MFEHAAVRFGTSGTLILAYAIADHLARARGIGTGTAVPPPSWVRPLFVISIGAFYLLIGPAGGPIAGGFVNLGGIALVGLSMVMRFGRAVRYPDLGGRMLFYLALPIAVGVPWGLLALSAPAWAASLVVCLHADRLHYGAANTAIIPTTIGAPRQADPRYRLLPGLW